MRIFQKQFLAGYLLSAVLALGSSLAHAQVSLSIDIAPPPMVVYEQPACPDDGYLWTPGYWAYGDGDYYWVPGTWVQPPEVGLLWTPGYWGWNGNGYAFNDGYWGPNVGFYGGIDYGYGYNGSGYNGGSWQGGHFAYNRSANNRPSASVSFNGGAGGVQAQPTAQERQFSSQRHTPATSVQTAHVQAASQDRSQFAKANGGKPATTAVAKPEAYTKLAQQHTAAQPLKPQDAVTPQAAVKPQQESQPAPEEKQAPEASQNKPAATSEQPQFKPQVKTEQTPQEKPEAAPQPRPEAVEKPQAPAESHAPAQAPAESHAPAQAPAESHAAPQGPGGGDAKPAANDDKQQQQSH